ncbi:MAG: hypothetical protein J6S02_05525 [Bacteroidaceae bacterium]|nr:hypothetical protein [Bacteroidaceae bacterium]
MTKKEFEKMFRLFRDVVVSDEEDLLAYSPSAHFIENCGGYELELHPSRIMWEREIVCLCALADRMCCSVESRFWQGSIIIR